MLDEPGVVGVFAAFTVTGVSSTIESPEGRPDEVTELLGDYEDEVLVDAYVTAGLTPRADYMFRVHARELTTAQSFLHDFRETSLGHHARQTEAFVGLVREGVYTPDAPDLEAELEATAYEGPEPPAYAVVVPARKTAEWWTLSDDERLELMRDHVEPTLEYLDRVRRQLYHASGLDDYDFITYFETDDLVAFQDLYRELQSVPEYRYVDYGDATLVGCIHEPATAVARVTRNSGR